MCYFIVLIHDLCRFPTFILSSVMTKHNVFSKIVNEYDKEIPQSQTADNPVAPRGRAAQALVLFSCLSHDKS